MKCARLTPFRTPRIMPPMFLARTTNKTYSGSTRSVGPSTRSVGSVTRLHAAFPPWSFARINYCAKLPSSARSAEPAARLSNDFPRFIDFPKNRVESPCKNKRHNYVSLGAYAHSTSLASHHSPVLRLPRQPRFGYQGNGAAINTPKQIVGAVPELLSDRDWYVEVRACYSGGGKLLKYLRCLRSTFTVKQA
jgi:hypothetical protein